MTKTETKMLFKVFSGPLFLYWAWGVLCIYVFQDSMIAAKHFKISPRFSEHILGILLFTGFIIVWRVILVRYPKITGQPLHKRHFFYWRFVIAMVLFVYLLCIGLWLTVKIP